jgi:alanine dehydrogenase
MRIGVPREIKDGEFRVGLTPRGVGALVQAGHALVVERGAGAGVGFDDEAYAAAGAQLCTAADAAWDCPLVVKVKELQPPEYRRPQRGQLLFCFQHFGPEPELLDAALASGATFVAYETVGQADGSLPILAPMSAIAGRLAVQVGMWCLQKPNGGSGVLLPGIGGVNPVAPGRVLILGAGNVGANALAIAHAVGAEVTLLAASERRLAPLRARYRERTEFASGPQPLAERIAAADLVIGGVLTPGQLSPKLIQRAMLARMRRGSALVDVGIDQGGIAETSRPTTHSDPIYVEEGVVHYCVPNMPSACARTASLALEAAALPYAVALAAGDLREALAARPALVTGVQVHAGQVTHAHLARDTRRSLKPIAEAGA